MASYDDIGSGSLGNLGEVLRDMTVNTAMTMARGLMMELTSTNIGNFNKMNHDFMTIHMMRNAYERVITLNTIGENAYRNGDGDATATPAFYPSYTKGTNYMEFVTDAQDGSKMGEMTTRVQKAGGENKNLYLDDDNIKDDQVNFTGKYTDKNSILYKTKRLMRQNKLKTIISQFHTNGVDYNGQVGTKQFGESHGRNLLRKEVVDGGTPYSRNGYDDPYCRVWTHHYKYDNLAKTIRGGNGDINTWENFFWGTETYDKDNKLVEDGHLKDLTEYGFDGENYDYAWRSKHNQERRKQNSVLDPKSTGTNLVNITPKYLGGECENIHTKSCMFSIENLAWKDYDPYSFEQALSWEQRGPFGGRIMWFPPYDIQIQETASAKWQPNEFIGRGEPVYTYVNSERTGNLSFLMLTDHPSSVDYASWWGVNDNAVENNGKDRLYGNAENDYLRYFAGCFDEDEDNKDDMTGGLHTTPTYLTDEYIKLNPPLVKPEKVKEKEPEQRQPVPKNPIKVEFYVYFPNNYSGVNDLPCVLENVNGSKVNSIVYLLAGRNAQKTGNINVKDYLKANKDNPLDLNTDLSGDGFIGYEMGNSGITTANCIEKGEYIQGSDKDRKWQYRVDHRQPIVSVDAPDNTLNQGVYGESLKDTNGNNLNLKVQSKYSGDVNMYSFAEVAAAFYKLEDNEKPNIYNYLIRKGVDETKVNKLLEIFTNQELINVDCKGWANWQGTPNKNTDSLSEKEKENLKKRIERANERNQALAANRGKTIATWLTNYEKWSNHKNDIKSEFEVKDSPTDNKDTKNENSLIAKEYRCAHCILLFSSEQSTEEENPEVPTEPKKDYPEYVGFRYLDTKVRPGNELWYYYEQSSPLNFYEQKPKTDNNYDSGDTTDTVVNVRSLYDIFDSDNFKPKSELTIVKDKKYRGKYNSIIKCNFDETTHRETSVDDRTYCSYGFYIEGYDYSEGTLPEIFYITDDYYQYPFTEGCYAYRSNRLYVNKGGEYTGPWDKNYFDDISQLIKYYKKGDIILDDDDEYYSCEVDYDEKYSYYHEFVESEWDLITLDNICDEDILADGYTYIGTTDDEYSHEDVGVDSVIYNTNKFGSTPQFMVCIALNPVDNGINEDYWYEPKFYEYGTQRIGYEWEVDVLAYIKPNIIPNVSKEGIYKCIKEHTTYYKTDFYPENWVFFKSFEECKSYPDNYVSGDLFGIYVDNDSFWYYVTKDISILDCYTWSVDLIKVFDKKVVDEEHRHGEYIPTYQYRKDDVCMVIAPDSSYEYYKAKYDLDSAREPIPLVGDDWNKIYDNQKYSYNFNWELTSIVKKVAALTCQTVKSVFDIITDNGVYTYNDSETYYSIWKYGEVNNIYENFNTSTVLVPFVEGLEPNSHPETSTENSKIRLNESEDRYLQELIKSNIIDIVSDDVKKITYQYIILHRVLDGITKVEDINGVRDVCQDPARNEDEMNLKTKPKSVYDNCNSNIWIDRGDGMLIQECYITEEGGNIKSRGTELNKIRYDQEYHFYKQYEIDHPVLFEKLQKKLKYFNPAFHSMTPEGFNARCTFLQQCTRQGNTKTMSDLSGKTANNLAFGRAPYCVLRLGDFYYQMIVIDNVSFDFNVSDGLQWDLNPEGNGVQPMLCKVNISFKFIGGGDITGPVQRLQNAMSFNYYANTSFYDNRADRVEYQATNWQTMGGAGNDKIDTDLSYAYLAKNYDTNDTKIYEVKPV